MEENDAPILLYTTLGSSEDAKTLARSLVSAGLAACANIFPPMTAIYEWDGEAREDAETAMIIKSRAGLQAKLLATAKQLHPYDTPALLIIQPSAVDADFREWIVGQTRKA